MYHVYPISFQQGKKKYPEAQFPIRYSEASLAMS